MKQVSAATTAAWLSGDYVGTTRPVQRATIQVPHMYPTPYTLLPAATTTWDHAGVFRTFNFNQDGPIREFPVQTIKWSRATSQDVATCTITIVNANWNSAQASEMGWYTPNHGTEPFSAQWNQSTNQWRSWFVPDRIVRTYEGYGTDGNADPAQDALQYPSGTWIIDTVNMTAAGDMTLTLRDYGELNIDQYAFPPVVPEAVYPLHFENKSTTPAGPVVSLGTGWFPPVWSNDSNQIYAAAGTYKDGPDPACTATGAVHGFSRSGMYVNHWLSVGSSQPDWSWWEGTPNASSLAIGSIRVTLDKGPGTVYVSVMDNTSHWYGTKKVPYQQNKDTANISASVPYVASQAVNGTGGQIVIQLPQSYAGFSKFRLTFISKYKTKIGKQRLYKTVASALNYNASNAVLSGGSGNVPTGNITDWSHIIRWVASWAGFHWPTGAHTSTLTAKPSATAPPADPILPTGSVWGDVRDCGAAPLTRLLQNNFDQRPLADAINFARETTGFNYFIDEWGGLIWRLPNNFTAGNFLAPTNGGVYTRTTNVVTINDSQTLIDLAVTTSNADVREQFFVADLQARFGAVVAGYNPAPSGIQRVAGWMDYEFASSDEALRTADLMAIRSFFKYRQNTLTIAANPAIQIDDQIIILERTTGEGYRHRVVGIDCTWSAEDGKWTYMLTTEWLGDQAFTTLPWDVNNLSAPTQAYLHALGAV